MPLLLDLLSRQMTGGIIRRLADQIGADETTTRKAVMAALPLIIGMLARNANNSQTDARNLERSLKQDHDGSILDNLDGLLGQSAGGHAITDAGNALPGGYTIDRRGADGEGILANIFGERRNAVELGISRASGLDVKKVAMLTPILALAIMSGLGKLRQEQKLDADGLARVLNRERADVEKGAPEVRRGILMDFLDSDRDGDVIEEVARIGSLFGDKSLLGEVQK